MEDGIVGLLLAAGLSSRMGQNKCLMLINGKPMAAIIAKKLLSVCHKVIVVTGHESEKVCDALRQQEFYNPDRIDFAFNSQYSTGMFSSLQRGLQAAEGADWVFYHFSDQPCLPDDFYPMLAAQIEAGSQWIQPIYGQRRGHPILLHSSIFNSILQVPGNSNLRECLAERDVSKKYMECQTPMISNDIDTPADFARIIGGNI